MALVFKGKVILLLQGWEVTLWAGNDQDINDFKKRVGRSTVQGLPKFDPNRGVSSRSTSSLPWVDATCVQVHALQTIEIIKPIPEVSGPGWKLTKRIVGISENSECNMPPAILLIRHRVS